MKLPFTYSNKILGKKIIDKRYQFGRSFHRYHMIGAGDFHEFRSRLQFLPQSPGILRECVGLGAADGQGGLGNAR